MLREAILSLSRHVHFIGKARLLDLAGIGPSNPDVVPEGVLSVRGVKGLTFHTTRPRDIMFRELYVNGLYQSDVLVALENLLKPGDVFWDVGANYGLMSMYVDRHFGGAVKSYAFEPSPVVLPELRRNIESNGCSSVTVEPCCLADKPGTVTFYSPQDNSWNATLIKDFVQSNESLQQFEVEASTIDAFVKRATPPSVIKIDVEGAEPLVVQGGSKWLAEAAVSIIAEYNVDAIRDFGWTPERYLGMYRDLGFTVQRLARPWIGLHRWRSLGEVTSPDELPTLCNVILTKQGSNR